jgi:hypothetical protein
LFARLRRSGSRRPSTGLATDSTVKTLLSEFGGRIDGVNPIE